MVIIKLRPICPATKFVTYFLGVKQKKIFEKQYPKTADSKKLSFSKQIGAYVVEALLGEKVEIRLLNAVYWVENPI